MMLGVKINRLVLILLLMSCFWASAQVYDFKPINQENGLPSSVITAITQDSRDLLWIGTDGAGLVKYDGTSFVTYDQSNGLEGGFITAITEDLNKNLVISTKYNGIYVFNGSKFFRQISQNNNEVSDNNITNLLSTNEGTYAINGVELIFISKEYKVKKLTSEKVEYIEPNSLVQNGKDIYIGAANGLFKFSNGKISAVPIPGDFGYTFVTKSNNKILASTYSGNIYTLTNSSFTKTLSLPDNLRFNIKRFYVPSSGNIWIAGDNNQGLYLYNGLNYIHFNEKNGFKGENISCFYQSRNKNLFIGTSGTGMFESGPQLFFAYNNVEYLNSSLIFSILLDKSNLYAGIRHSGIAKFRINEDGSYSLEKKFDEQVNPNAFLKNSTGDILAGCSEGLFVISNNKLKHINSIFKDKRIVHITSLAQDDNDNYLVGTFEEGLLVLDKNFNLVKQLSSKLDGDFTNFVLTINKKSNHVWYIGTNTGLFELKTKNEYDVTDQIISDVIGVSTFDSYGNFWCTGTNCIYSINNKKVNKFTKSNSLTSTLIYTLTADQNGFIWSGHNLGLDKIEVTKSGKIKSVKNYNSFNGFKGLETNMRSQFVDDDGNFYVGTVNGLISCNTNLKIENKVIPKLEFTNLKIFNNPVDWRESNTTDKWFNVPKSGHVFESSENQLTFEFALINTNHANNYLYSYKLNGLDKNWSTPGNQTEVTYSNLSYGKYEFQVKLINKDGGLEPELATYSFTIKTPFYYKWWFILLIVLFTATVFLLMFSKSSTYNKEFVKDYSEERSKHDEIRIYLLFFGLVAPVTEIIIFLFGVRRTDELIMNFAVGITCLFLYFISKRLTPVTKYIYHVFVVIVGVFAASIAYKIYFTPFELITFAEFIVVLFFSNSLFKTNKQYWVFTGGVMLFLFSLFYNKNIPLQTTIVYFDALLFSVLIYQANYISGLNSKSRLLFTDTIVNKGSSLVIASDKNGYIIFISQNVKEILGYEPDELMGEGWWKHTIESNTEEPKSKEIILAEVKKQGTSLRKIKTKSGDYRWIQWKDKKFGNETVVGIGQDVTEQIHAQNQYQNLIQTATDIIYESNKAGIITFINPFAKKLLGYEPNELLGKHYSDLVRDDFKPLLQDFYTKKNQINEEYEALEFPISKKNGEEIWVSQKVSIRKDDKGELIGYSGIVRDISKIKQIEFEIKESESNFRQINETIDDVFWLYDTVKNEYIFISNSCEKVLGMKAEDFYAGKNYGQLFVHEDDREVYKKVERLLTDKDTYDIQYRIRTTNGEIKWINEKSFAVKDADGRVTKNSGVCSDITGKKLAEDKLKESENNFRQLNETIQDVFWLYDIVNKKYLYISPSCEKVMGIHEDFLYKGNSMKTVVHKDDLQKVIDANLQVDAGLPYQIEYRILVKDQVRWISEKSFAIKDAKGNVIRNSGICTDITERVLNQQKIDSQAETVKQYSKELEYHNTIKEKLIHCKTVEEISLNTLGFIKSNLSQCQHIALLRFNNKKERMKGYFLHDNKLIREEILSKNIKSFDKCKNGEIFIEHDLNATNNLSPSDESSMINGIRSYIVFPLNYANEMIGILSIGFSTKFSLSQQEIKNIKDASEIISITLNQINLRNKLERYSKDLEFQNIVKQKLINASSIEEITQNALDFVLKETNGCTTIAVNTLDDRKAYLVGYKLIGKELVAETWKFDNEMNCYHSLLKHQNYIEHDVFKSESKSYTDSLYLDKGERSYIVLPILDNQELIGAMSLGFQTPFQLKDWEINRLEELTFILNIALKQVKLNNSIVEKNTNITSSINYAKNIQNSILPNLKEMQGSFKNVSLLYRPKDIVSGDFYGAIEQDRYTYLYAADCTGHGVPGAFITLLGNMILEQLIRGERLTKPADILSKLDEQIYTILNHRKEDLIRDGMEIAMCVIDRKTNVLTFSGAGMGLLYYLNEQEFYLKGQRKAIGENKSEESPFTNQEIKITGKEQFYMASDGYQDQLGGNGYKRFSKKQLMELLNDIKFKNSLDQEKQLQSTLDNYIGKHKQIDDITILGFTINTNKDDE